MSCPTGASKVVVSYQNTAGPFTTLNGKVRLAQRLDNVIGMTVKSMVMRCDGSITLSRGFLFKLKLFNIVS
jgi:hypothetical protein